MFNIKIISQIGYMQVVISNIKQVLLFQYLGKIGVNVQICRRFHINAVFIDVIKILLK